MSQQQLFNQELTISQILRIFGKQFTQTQMQYSDGCAIGVIMTYFGWDDKDDIRASRKLLSALIVLTNAGVSNDLVVQLNDSGMSFDEIADYIDENETYELTHLK